MNEAERYRAVSRIFIEVCGLKGDARRAELNRLCRGLPDLRSEVESLLAFHDAPTPASDGDPRSG